MTTPPRPRRNLASEFSLGVRCLLRGYGLAFSRGLRPWALGPIVLTTALYVWLSFEALGWRASIVAWVEDSWAGDVAYLAHLVDVLIIVMLVLLVVFTFAILSAIIASPFQGPLAASAQKKLTGSAPVELGLKRMLATLPGVLADELRKIWFVLWTSALLFLILLIPPLPAIAPIVMTIWGGCLAALAFGDFALANNHVRARDMRRVLRGTGWASFGYGLGTVLALMVPLLAIFTVPAAAAAGALMWQERWEDEAIRIRVGRPPKVEPPPLAMPAPPKSGA